MNKVTLIGRLGKDPETRTFESGGSVTTLSVATSRRYKNKSGDKVEETEWHAVKAFGKTGEFAAKYFKKGEPIALTGRIHYDSYEKDGQKRYYTEIIVEEIEFVPAASGGGSEPEPAPASGDEDLPF